jgi:hypothetical protein
MDAVVAHGDAPVDDPDRFGDVTALELDETLRCRLGPWHTQWSTQIVDVGRGQLLNVVEGRSAAGPCRRLAAWPQAWRDAILWATLDLSDSYRKASTTMLPDATQVADPFHVTKLANTKLDECRRRVQNETMGHRGRKTDPLYRCRCLVTRADERLDEPGHSKLLGLLDAGDPKGEVRAAWHARRLPVRSTSTTTTTSPSRSSTNSATISRTKTTHPRFDRWAARRSAGETRAPLGAHHTSRTDPPKPSTTSSRESNTPRSGSPTGATTESGHCSTPANQTGNYSTPSNPAETRSATLVSSGCEFFLANAAPAYYVLPQTTA